MKTLRPLTTDTTASFIPVVLYIIGLMVFGFFTWLFDHILVIFRETNIADTTTYGDTYSILWMAWYGIIVIYLIFGGIWLVRTYNEQQYQGGF